MNRRKDSRNRVLKEGEHQRRNGSYEYKWRSNNGKRHSIYAKTLEELRQKEEKLQRDKTDGIRTGIDHITLNDIYDMWANLKKGVKGNTFSNYKYMYNKFVYHELGKIKITKLRRSDVKRFYNSLANKKGLKITTVDNIHTVLHQVLDMAVDDDYIRKNPSNNALKELKLSRKFENDKKKSLTLHEQKLFIDFIKKSRTYNRWYPIFMTMLNTGLRVGEVTGLRWQDIDFQNNNISVNHTLVYYKQEDKGCGFVINTPKSKAGIRTVPMIGLVKDAILKEREYQNLLNIKCNVELDGYTDFIFLNRFGKLHNQASLNRAIKRIVRECNNEIINSKKEDEDVILLPNISCHILRHTFATRLIESGVNFKVVQSILGHADFSTTMDIYADCTNEFKESEFKLFSEYLDKN